jgi:hypothetical protein
VRDSGRYGLSAACSRDDKWLACEVGMRDLVYDTVLLPSQKLSATLDGAMGASVQFEGHPAQGKTQLVLVAVSMVDGGSKKALARVEVQVREGEHVVQDYSVTFPVSRTSE